MKKRIIAIACGIGLLISIGGCPIHIPNSAKTSTQPAAQQVVVAPSNALGL